MDQYLVRVDEFRRFVKATGYITIAERPLSPDADPVLLVPDSRVFHKTRESVDLHDYHNWWAYVPGASWKRPGGRGSALSGRHNHPVTQVAYEDAKAYAHWV